MFLLGGSETTGIKVLKTMSEASGGTADAQVPTQLTYLVPQFDPSQHDLEQYSQKVEMLSEIWPANKINELITRLILSTSGAAFQKLQLQRSELLTGDKKGVAKLITILGGQWGKVSLEKKYETFERAVYRCQQKSDESHDSFLARADVLWSELLASKVTLQELQAYTVLRGSQLSSEDKKRVVLESEASESGKLEMSKVNAAVRMLGSGFFHDVTGTKKAKGKVYDAHALVVEESDEIESALVADEWTEEDAIDHLAAEGDEDAILICEFETAVQDAIQDDQELAMAYNAYTDARRRLSERSKNRGFWPNWSSSSSKGKNKGGKGKGKQFSKGPRKSLQQRILESHCRNCGRRGHWRAECPDRARNSQSSSAAPQAPTMSVSTEVLEGDQDSMMPQEFMILPEISEQRPTEARMHFAYVSSHVEELSWGNRRRGKYNENNQGDYLWSNRIRDKWGFSPMPPLLRNEPKPRSERVFSKAEPVSNQSHACEPAEAELIMFASHSSFGILDSGATKTVIGSKHVAELLNSLHPEVRKNIRRCSCEVTFRFGNQGTLDSKHALVIPIGQLGLKVAVVPGETPLLLSNTLLRTLRATVDVAQKQLISPFLQKPVGMSLSPRGLFLVDVNELVMKARNDLMTAETFMHETKDGSAISGTNGSAEPKESQVFEKSMISTHSMSHTNQSKECKDHQKPHQYTPTSVAESRSSHVHMTNFNHANFQSFESSQSPNQSSECQTKSITESSQSRSKHDSGVSHPQPGTKPNTSVIDSRSPDSHHESGRTFREAESESGGRRVVGDVQEQIHRGHGPVSGDIRESQLGQVLHGSMVNPEAMASVVHEDLRDLDKGGAPETVALHHAHDRACRARDGGGESTTTNTTDAQDQGSTEGQGPSHAHAEPRGRDRRGGSMDGCRDDVAAQLCVGPQHAGDNECPAGAHEPSGERPGRNSEPSPHQCLLSDLSWAEGMRVAGDLDAEEECLNASCMSNLQSKFNDLVAEISAEFRSVSKHVRPVPGQAIQVLEVFSDSSSELTRQTVQLGYKGMRFGYQQGDLSTSEGRKKLFEIVLQKQPANLWYSPVCGPWSSWNNLNASRSLAQFDAIHQQRVQHLYQLALGVVLFRHQFVNRRHFHWEQPRRSLMFMTPLLKEIYEHTYSTTFDLCRVGLLTDPENQKFIKKGLEIRTTSFEMHKSFHGRYCKHDHEHQTLEGSTVHKGHRKLRTEFSELYPRKFARSLARVLTGFSNRRQDPKDFAQWNAVFAVSDKRKDVSMPNVQAKRLKTNTARLIEPQQMPRKRRRLGEKQPDEPINDMMSKIVEAVRLELPRVGRKEIMNPEITQAIQEVFHEKQVMRVIACKGTERTLAPPSNLMRGEAPFRRTIAVERQTQKIFVEDQWEEWEMMSQRQIVRKLLPCAINITVFACNPTENPPEMPIINPSSEPQSSVSERHEYAHRPQQLLVPPAQVSEEQEQPVPVPTVSATEPQNSSVVKSQETDKLHQNVLIDAESIQQGTKFKALKSEERQLLLRLHKNLGHPSPAVLSQVLRRQGYSSHIIQGLEDMKCSTCQHQQGPKIQRPATIKSAIDFGDKVSLDGVTWTNKNGKKMHFYHFLDHGTNYHTASIAPNRTTERAIENMTTGWLAWAGPPNEILADSATEFNNEAFEMFMRQMNVRCTIIPPQAHWQLGKTERHGEVLQHMLSKFEEDHPINSYQELQVALMMCTAAKNACSLRHGFSPEVLVFGKGLKVPGSLTSDDSLPAHSLASEDNAWGLRFREQLAMRENARKAFHDADNNAAIRASGPEKGQARSWHILSRRMGDVLESLRNSQRLAWACKGSSTRWQIFCVLPAYGQPCASRSRTHPTSQCH